MHLTRNIGKATVMSLILLTASVMLMTFQPVNAQIATTQPVSGPLPSGVAVDFTSPTTTFLSFRPTLVGVGQSVLVNMWISPALASNNRLLPKAFYVTITKPDGDKDTRTLDSEPATGATWFEFSPDQVGEWTIKVDFLGTYYPAGRYLNGYIVTNTSGTAYGSCYYTPSSTSAQKLTVQQDFVWSWPVSPLPTDYWTRPVSPEHREWWPILGNFPGTGYQGGGSMWDTLYPDTSPTWSSAHSFHPWVQGPNSAHIVWKRQGALAGITGGPAGQYGIASSPGNPSVVYAGRAYQTVTKVMTVLINGTYRQQPTSVATCYDLRTGETYYDIPTADGGVTPSYIAYIAPTADRATSTWSVDLLSISGDRLYKVNPLTGAVTGNYSIAPLSGGSFYNQIDGYVLNVQDLGAAATNATGGRYRLINWTTEGTSATLTSRIISNTSYARSSLPTYIDYNVGRGAAVTAISPYGLSAWFWYNIQIFNLKTGELMHNITTGDNSIPFSFVSSVADHGKIAVWTQHGEWLAYDLVSGQLAWRSETADYPWASSGFGAYSSSSAYGKIFFSTYDGIYAWNWEDGTIAWSYKSLSQANFESPYVTLDGKEEYPFRCDPIIADGKVYAWNMEHTESHPLTRGWGIHCINATTGEGIWNVSLGGDAGLSAIADGYATLASNREGYMYVFGKGKSATTVTAPDVVVPKGTGVVIKGTILDLSPAQPNTPAVSKGSMKTQMEYLHKQMPIDGLWHNETLTGVPVSLTAIGSDGSYIDLGTVVTDGYYGTFSKTWTPTAEGDYKVIASFAGDESYGSSAASTSISIGPAPTEKTDTGTQKEIVIPDYTMTIVAGVVAIIIAVALVGILLFKKIK